MPPAAVLIKPRPPPAGEAALAGPSLHSPTKAVEGLSGKSQGKAVERQWKGSGRSRKGKGRVKERPSKGQAKVKERPRKGRGTAKERPGKGREWSRERSRKRSRERSRERLVKDRGKPAEKGTRLAVPAVRQQRLAQLSQPLLQQLAYRLLKPTPRMTQSCKLTRATCQVEGACEASIQRGSAPHRSPAAPPSLAFRPPVSPRPLCIQRVRFVFAVPGGEEPRGKGAAFARRAGSGGATERQSEAGLERRQHLKERLLGFLGLKV